jgi:hypothetical protein
MVLTHGVDDGSYLDTRARPVEMQMAAGAEMTSAR